MPRQQGPQFKLQLAGEFRWRVKRSAALIAHIVGARYWFPHTIFSLALLADALHILKDAFGIRMLRFWAHPNLSALGVAEIHLAIGDLFRLAISIAMIVMSIGLALRSRLAWLLTLVLLAAIVLLQVKHQVGASWWLYYEIVLLAALLLTQRHFSRTSVAAATLYALTATFMLLFYGVFGAFYLGADFRPAIKSLGTAFYFTIVTMTTVGYGDIVPTTLEARMFTVSVIVLGITVFATSLGAVITPAISNSVQRIIKQREKPMQRKEHFIVIGATALAHNTAQELQRRQLPVTLILPSAPQGGELEGTDTVIGDATDANVLSRAGAEQARAVLAMRADDSENAFIILALKEIETKAKLVAAVNDMKNYKRVQRVQPDMIVAPQILGGELLAMTLAGETIPQDFVLQRLFTAS